MTLKPERRKSNALDRSRTNRQDAGTWKYTLPFFYWETDGREGKKILLLTRQSEYRARSPSAPSRSLPKPRSRTVPFPNGFACAPTTRSGKLNLAPLFYRGLKRRGETQAVEERGVTTSERNIDTHQATAIEPCERWERGIPESHRYRGFMLYGRDTDELIGFPFDAQI